LTRLVREQRWQLIEIGQGGLRLRGYLRWRGRCGGLLGDVAAEDQRHLFAVAADHDDFGIGQTR